MKKIIALMLVLPFLVACHKKPDAPQRAATQSKPNDPPPPPPVSNCQGATVVYTMPVATQTDGTTANYVIPNFEKSCGDTLQVLIKNTNAPVASPWTTLLEDPAGSSYYAVTNQTVSVHVNTGNITLYVEIIATLL